MVDNFIATPTFERLNTLVNADPDKGIKGTELSKELFEEIKQGLIDAFESLRYLNNEITKLTQRITALEEAIVSIKSISVSQID